MPNELTQAPIQNQRVPLQPRMPTMTPSAPISNTVPSKGLGAQPPVGKAMEGDHLPTAPRTTLGGNATTPRNYQGQMSDRRLYTKRLARRAQRSLTR